MWKLNSPTCLSLSTSLLWEEHTYILPEELRETAIINSHHLPSHDRQHWLTYAVTYSVNMHAMSKGGKQWVGLALNGSLETEKRSHVPSNQYWQSEASSNVLQWKTYWWQGGQLELSTALSKIPSSKKKATEWPTWYLLAKLNLMGKVFTLHAGSAV